MLGQIRLVGMLTAVGLACHGLGLAHSPAVLKAIYTRTPPALDGDLQGWLPLPGITVHSDRGTFAFPLDDRDASYTVWAQWDARALYLAFRVVDDSCVGEHTGEKIYENDCVEVCFDPRHDSYRGYNEDDFQLVIAAPKGEMRVYRNPLLGQDFLRGIEGAFIEGRGGWIVKLKIPADKLGVELRDGLLIGFQNDIRDYDKDGSCAGLCWVEDKDPAANPLTFGHLLLCKTAADPVPDLESHCALARSLLNGKAESEEGQAALTLLEPTGTPAPAVGWNLQFYDGRIPPWEKEHFDSFLAVLDWSEPRWIRYGLNLNHWEPQNDDDDANHLDWPGFRFDSPIMQLHYRVFDFCEKRRIPVLVTNWCAYDPATGNGWLSEKPPIGGPRSGEEFAESMAALVRQLKVIKRYDCVKWLSLWNEPNLSSAYSSEHYPYPDGFLELYALVDARLKKEGLRDKIALFGPDCTVGGNYLSLRVLPKIVAPFPQLDVLGIHDYVSYYDWHRIHNSQAYSLAEEELRRFGQPLVLSECGNMGNGPNDVVGDARVYRGSLAVCEQILRLSQAGVRSFARWEFKPYGVHWQNFGALTSLSRDYLFEPYRPVFFPHSLLTKAIEPGSVVVPVRVTGGADSSKVPAAGSHPLPPGEAGSEGAGLPRLHAGAFSRTTADGQKRLSLVIINDGSVAKTVKITALDVPKLRHLSYDATLPKDIVQGGDLAVENGSLSVTLQPMSLNVLLSHAETEAASGSSRPRVAWGPPQFVLPPRKEPVYDGRRVTLHFDSPLEWSIWQSSEGTCSIETRDSRLTVSCGFVTKEGDRGEHIVAQTPVLMDQAPTKASVNVLGDGIGMKLQLLFLDALAEHFPSADVITVDWKGWKHVEFTKPLGGGSWNGDGKLDLPICGVGVIIEEPSVGFTGKGEIALDELEFTR